MHDQLTVRWIFRAFGVLGSAHHVWHSITKGRFSCAQAAFYCSRGHSRIWHHYVHAMSTPTLASFILPQKTQIHHSLTCSITMLSQSLFLYCTPTMSACPIPDVTTQTCKHAVHRLLDSPKTELADISVFSDCRRACMFDNRGNTCGICTDRIATIATSQFRILQCFVHRLRFETNIQASMRFQPVLEVHIDPKGKCSGCIRSIRTEGNNL